jgi:hypothetical protein
MPVSADELCRSGISYPVAIEIARQMNAGAGNGNAKNLMALGISTTAAGELAAHINANAFDGHKLARSGWNSQIAATLKRTSGL